MSTNLLFKPSNRHWLIGLIVAATGITSAIAIYGVSQFGFADKPASNQVETTPRIQKVTALARLEPEAEVIKLSAPLALDGDRIAKILVSEGDTVKAGQVVAILDSRDRLQDAFEQTQQQINVAKAKLAQVKAGAKTGEIQAQQASVERLQAQLQGDKIAQVETIARLKAQLQGDNIAQQATIRKLEAELN
ncbi:MAG: biotin/lipoyl-binding protein, partial [Tolypothrix sp. Co-bin9]|nr:biotin/lipoyl-binding protein [Tolypothrix sp. Co-bin9]